MSLDGYVADPSDGVEQVFSWYFGGDVSVPTASPQWTFQVSEPSAKVLRGALSGLGALVGGRRLFDITGGWGGRHPMGVPVFVVTHTTPKGWPRPDTATRFTFVTDGVEAAVRQASEAAGDKLVAIASPNVAQQALNAGLLDEIHIDLVPVLLGAGVPFFDNVKNAPVRLEAPEIVAGDAVTHLRYRVGPGTAS
jgi:dihydrofolate reductase